MKFTKDQHNLWKALVKKQLPNVKKFACREYLLGSKILDLPKDKIPSLSFLNNKITRQTGWKAMRTKYRYIDSIPWYQHFARKEFVITNFLRTWEEFEFTHEPDMFHDIFGHLPYHTVKHYTDFIEMFSPAFLGGSKQQQEDIKKLAWFSYEFGLIKENNNLKIFGAGLISSIGEIHQVMSGKTPIIPFTIENVLKRNKAIYTFNKELFVFDSIEALKKELRRYFDRIDTSKSINTIHPTKIMDKQMTGIR